MAEVRSMAAAQLPGGPHRQGLGSTEDVAGYLQIPAATLVQWRARRTGPRYCRVGRHVRYRWDDVERWLDEQARDGPEAA